MEPYGGALHCARVVFGVWLAPSAPTKAWPTARAPAATRHPSPAPAGRYTSAPHSPAEKRTHRTHGVSEHVRLAAVFFRPPTAPHGLSPLPASRSTSWMSTRAIATGTSAKRSTAGRVRRPPPTPTPSHTHTHTVREGRGGHYTPRHTHTVREGRGGHYRETVSCAVQCSGAQPGKKSVDLTHMCLLRLSCPVAAIDQLQRDISELSLGLVPRRDMQV